MKKIFAFFFILQLCFSTTQVSGQLNYKVLFLGNSYTGVNNLPQLIHDIALSAGDTLIFDSHTPGGYQLESHSLDVISQNKIMAGGWNYVVLQGQSQEPIVATTQFNVGAHALYNLIKQYNPCSVTMPYMTWGRKNGDASNCPFFPVMCTYEGMDSTLKERYIDLTESLNGELSPVSVVWNFIRQNYPAIELYQPDESHPSPEGSYAAACCFYATIFKKDPTFITNDYGLNAANAAIIRSAAKSQVFDNLQLYDYKKMPVSDFRYSVGPGINEIIFNPINQGVQQDYFWDLGTGTTSTLQYITYNYITNGIYTVSLTTSNCDLQGLHTSFSDTVIQFCNHTPTVYTSNPWMCNVDTLWTQPADTYQWFINGTSIPETNQFLDNYLNYGISGFSVISSSNGCAELSQAFTETPEWSGYYFDLMGNPCTGDTVAFAVLHINGFLSGAENILWYKNDTLLTGMTDEDTLFISEGGKYQCKVINQNSICPLDTTSYLIEYNCGVIGIEEAGQKTEWSIFPNPVSEILTIKFEKIPFQKRIQIYNALGILKKTIIVWSEETKIDMADLEKGVYFLRLSNEKLEVKRFLKL